MCETFMNVKRVQVCVLVRTNNEIIRQKSYEYLNIMERGGELAE